jgi:hypothetical protein
MSKTQLIILWIGIVIFVLMGLFPPAQIRSSRGGRYIEYEFILNSANISFSRLFVQWAIVAIITGGLIYSLKVDPDLILKFRCFILSRGYDPDGTRNLYEKRLKRERKKRENQQGNAPPEKQTQKDKEI